MLEKNCNRAVALFISALMLSTAFTACKSKPAVNNSSSMSSVNAEVNSSDIIASSDLSASVLSLASGQQTVSGSKKSSYSAPAYSNKSVFNKNATKKETKLSLNNSGIKGRNIASSAAAASIVKRTQVEGVDGSFYDANLNESVRNLNGKTYAMLSEVPDDYKESGAHVTPDSKRCAQALKSIESDYNCKIKIETMTGDEVKKITTAKSAGKVLYNIFDIQADAGDLILKNAGLGADLLQVNTVGVKANQWNPAFTLLSSYKSRVYGVAVRYDRLETDLLYFNKALAQKYNLGDFYDMVNKKQWTLDRFLQVSEQFKKAAGGNMYPMVVMYPIRFLDLVYTNWTSPFGITESKYIFNGTDSTVLDMLNYCQRYVKEGLLDPYYDKSDIHKDNTFHVSGGELTHAFSEFDSSKCLFFYGSNHDLVLPYVAKNCKDDYGLLPLPKGPASDDYTTVIDNAIYFGLTGGDPDIDNSGALLTAIANRTNIKTADIISYNSKLVRDKESIETLTQNYKYKQIINTEMCNAGNMSNYYNCAAIPCVYKGETTPKQAMEGIAIKAQAEIDKSYGQK